MKIPRIVHAIGHIDDDLIAAAAESKQKTKHNLWFKWGTVAACFAVLVIAGAVILPLFLGSDEPVTGKYKYQISGSETDIEWPWEYKTNGEKYQSIQYNGKGYSIKSLDTIDEELLGDVLGFCETEGVDSYTGKRYTETFEIRKINGVSEEKLVAAGNASGFYVYMLDDVTKPATFGEVMDLYGLEQNLEFNHFVVYEGYDEKDSFDVRDDAYIQQILSECRDAPLYDEVDSFNGSNRNYLSFTATSEVLGVYKRAVYISEDGYFATNILDYSCSYFIGEGAAGKIISYAKSNSTETESEPYELEVTGTLIEIGDGYVLVDDTVLCANEEDGMVYKIFTDDIRVRRGIECSDMKVGDTVVVKYKGTISDHNEVSGAYSMYKGTLVDGDLAMPE